MTKGDKVSGHFCIDCLCTVDHSGVSKENPYKTDWCIKCNHRSEGLNSTGMVGDFLVIGRIKDADK